MPETLAPAPDGMGGAWSPAEFIIFADRGRLYRIPASGGQVKRVTELWPAKSGIEVPYFYQMADSYVADGSAEAGGVHFAEITHDGTAGTPRRILGRVFPVDYMQTDDTDTCVIFFRRGDLLAQRFHLPSANLLGSPRPVVLPGHGSEGTQVKSVSISRNNIAVMDSSAGVMSAVVLVDRAGQVKTTLSPVAQQINLGLSPDDAQIMVTRSGESLDLWLHDLKRGTNSRFTSDPAADGVPVWSPDGSAVVFASWRDGTSNLYIKPTDGSSPERPLLASKAAKYSSDWSTDGRYIMFESTTSLETPSDIWVLPVSPDGRGGQPEVYLNSEFRERDGRFSPDVLWVAYVSDETGRDEVYVQSFPTGRRKWQISTGRRRQARLEAGRSGTVLCESRRVHDGRAGHYRRAVRSVGSTKAVCFLC